MRLGEGEEKREEAHTHKCHFLVYDDDDGTKIGEASEEGKKTETRRTLLTIIGCN